MGERVRWALRSHPLETIVFYTLTFNPDDRRWRPRKGFTGQERAFLGAYACWNKLRLRLRREFGDFKYVCVIEQTKKGWPHLHVAICSPVVAAFVARERLSHRRIRPEWCERAQVGAGFGPISDIDIARGHDAVAGYVMKVSRVAESDAAAIAGEQTKLSQLPLYAPRGFRRIRASQLFLKPREKNPDIKIQVWAAPRDAVEYAAGVADDRRRKKSALKNAERAEQAAELFEVVEGGVMDRGTGEVFTDLLGDILQGRSLKKCGRLKGVKRARRT